MDIWTARQLISLGWTSCSKEGTRHAARLNHDRMGTGLGRHQIVASQLDECVEGQAAEGASEVPTQQL